MLVTLHTCLHAMQYGYHMVMGKGEVAFGAQPQVPEDLDLPVHCFTFTLVLYPVFWEAHAGYINFHGLKEAPLGNLLWL